MIAVLISVVLAGLLMFLAWAATFKSKNPLLGKSLGLGLVTMAALTLIAGLALYPASSRWKARSDAEAMEALAKGQANSIQYLSVALGGTQAYIDYLKARGNE